MKYICCAGGCEYCLAGALGDISGAAPNKHYNTQEEDMLQRLVLPYVGARYASEVSVTICRSKIYLKVFNLY